MKYFLFVWIPRASFYVWTAFCLFGIGLFATDSTRSGDVMGLPFAFLPVFVYSWFAMFKLFSCDNEFDKAYKLSFVIEELQAAFDDVCYRPLEGVPESDISKTHMPKVGSYRYSSDDYLEATYKGVHFRQSDVMFLSDDSDSGGTSEVCFHGPWMIFPGNKKLVGEVQIVEHGFDFAHHDRKRGAVRMEAVQFNDRFDVFAQDAHDAFYVLTPDVIETLLEFAGNTKHKFMVGFVNDEIHVTLDLGRGMFETDLESGYNAESVRQKVRRDIGIITKVIDELVLRVNLGGLNVIGKE